MLQAFSPRPAEVTKTSFHRIINYDNLRMQNQRKRLNLVYSKKIWKYFIVVRNRDGGVEVFLIAHIYIYLIIPYRHRVQTDGKLKVAGSSPAGIIPSAGPIDQLDRSLVYGHFFFSN